MRAYADSSFILRLVTRDNVTTSSIDEYRRLGRPILFYLPLHDLEVRNGIFQRAFFARSSLSAPERKNYGSRRDAELARLDALLGRRTLLAVSLDTDIVFARATQLSIAHTEKTGIRSFDVLHVASALELESEFFLTSDARQANVAKAVGLETVLIE